VKPAAFDYVRAESLEEVLDVLANEGTDARVLAGGQTLIPMLSMRMARPSVVIDIMRLPGLDRIEGAEGTIRVGALGDDKKPAAFDVALAGPLQGVPALGDGFLLLPLAEANGVLARINLDDRSLIKGADWRAVGAEDRSRGHVALWNATQCLATDGSSGIARIDFDSDKSVSHHGIDFQRNKIIRSVSAWLIRCHAYWFHLVQWREESRTLCIDHRCAESGRDLPRSLVPFAKSWTAPRPACAPGN